MESEIGTPESGTQSQTVENIDSQIAEIRADPDYSGERFRHGTIAQKNLQTKLRGLYAQKRELAAAGNVATKPPETEADGNRSRSLDPAKIDADDLSSQAEQELNKLAEMGVDVSDVDNMTPERIEGLKHLRLIEEGNFGELGASLGSSAYKAGWPTEEVGALREFLRKTAKPNAELTKDLLRVVANHIYRNRTEKGE